MSTTITIYFVYNEFIFLILLKKNFLSLFVVKLIKRHHLFFCSQVYDTKANFADTVTPDTRYHLKSDSSGAFHITFSSGIVYIDKVSFFRRLAREHNITIETDRPRLEIILTLYIHRLRASNVFIPCGKRVALFYWERTFCCLRQGYRGAIIFGLCVLHEQVY